MPIDFRIFLDDPCIAYFPGQMVTGKVVFATHSEESTRGLQLQFEGRAIVHWTELHTDRSDHHHDGNRSNAVTTTKSYDDFESFFKLSNYLLGNGRWDVKIPAGENSYPFSFQVPMMQLPSSFNGTHGRVEYVLLANIKRSWSFDYYARHLVTVNSVVDLNNDFHAAQSGEWKTSKTFCCLCCASGPMTMTVWMKTKGYVSGEPIQLEVEVNNRSTKSVVDLSAEVIQEATFYAQHNRIRSLKTILKVKRGEGIQAGDSDMWRSALQVPVLPPTKLGGCRIIDVQYVVKVEAHVLGIALNLYKSCPIIIGTVPLDRNNLMQADKFSSIDPPLFTPTALTALT